MPRCLHFPSLLLVVSLAGCSAGATTSADAASATPTDAAAADLAITSPIDAATADAPGATDAGSGCRGLAGTVALCDDFEGAPVGLPPDPARWSVVTPNCGGTGTIAVDSAGAHGSRGALVVRGQGGYCNHVFVRATVAAPSPRTYARFYLSLDAALGPDHVTIAALSDGHDGGKDLRLGGQAHIVIWNRESDDATLPELSPRGIAGSVALTPGPWHCVELLVNGSGGSGTVATWIDGVAPPGLQVDGTATPDLDAQWLRRVGWSPQPLDLRLGWESYGGAAMTLWIDDVVLADHRVGCGG